MNMAFSFFMCVIYLTDDEVKTEENIKTYFCILGKRKSFLWKGEDKVWWSCDKLNTFQLTVV